MLFSVYFGKIIHTNDPVKSKLMLAMKYWKHDPCSAGVKNSQEVITAMARWGKTQAATKAAGKNTCARLGFYRQGGN